MNPPKIIYPCAWTYTVMGLDEEDLRLCAGELLRGRPHRMSFSRQSPGKKYTAMHIDMQVESEEDRNRIFDAFRRHPKIKFVL